MSKPMFQKRHYEAIAATIQKLVTAGDEYTRKHIAEQFADLFAKDNPRFDRYRFLAASVPGANVRKRPTAKSALANVWRDAEIDRQLRDQGIEPNDYKTDGKTIVWPK